ncbi:MAG: DUF2703 domain-containing protein [Bryobacteraceae bacterium]|nr:DUF2703 domain-containing protein [Bryobacteraceae bacterium]
MRIEVLFFDGCPNHRLALERVNSALAQEGVEAEVIEVRVPDEAAARELGFLGSPTVRINGQDVEPAARGLKQFGMCCRTYFEGGRRSGAPSQEMIRAALREALGAER